MCPGFVYGDTTIKRDAGAVAEEVERLHVARVVVAAAFVEGDEDGGVLRIGDACTWSTIFFTNPSNRSSFEDAGWPST
jgi:hypothetical protein